MIQPINPGAVLPFFATANPMAHSRQVTFQPDGWRLLASNQELLPFIFWLDAPLIPVTAFSVINLGTGKVTELNPALIFRRQRDDFSRSWYFFVGQDIGQVLPCGRYRIRVNLSGTQRISDEIELIETRPEHIGLTKGACAADVLTLDGADTLNSNVNRHTLQYRRDTESSWTTLSATTTNPYSYDLDLGAITIGTDNLLLRRTIATAAGNLLRTYHTLTWDDADPCGTAELLLIDDRSSYARQVWTIELADAIRWGDKIYEDGFIERVYLRGHWDFPQAEREVQVLTDNAGGRVITAADTRQFLTMEFEDVADHLVYVLSALGDYSDITLRNTARTYEFTGINGAEAAFTFEPNAGYYSRGRLRFRHQKHFESPCAIGETTV